MDYDDIAAHFLVPSGKEPAPPELPSSSARRLRDAVEVIATIGWWSREATDASLALGHDFFDGYLWGRAAALGADVDAAVVSAAFGVFSPLLVGPVYAHARTISSRDQILAARASGATAGLQAATSEVPSRRSWKPATCCSGRDGCRCRAPGPFRRAPVGGGAGGSLRTAVAWRRARP